MTLGKRTGIILIIFQLALIVAFAFVATYGEEADSKNILPNISTNIYYPMFQDVQVMILVGFGMIMTFLKRYSYSGAGLNFLVSAITYQYGLLLQRMFGPLRIGMKNLINADLTSAAILISMGAVLGKTTPLQMLLMVLVEVPICMGNQYLSTFLQVADIGGSVSAHTFGAYFGLGLSKILGKPKDTSLEGPSYQTDLFSIIGTLFLWVFWPSFNGALSWEDGQQRAVINTYLALIASCVISFAVSTLTHHSNKFTMVHIQNATLAGGVAIGTVADLMVMPYAALLIGGLAGAVSTLGYVYLQPWLLHHLDLHDTCGVNNLHGMPSLIAATVGIIAASQASLEMYGPKLYLLFPARAPFPSSKELKDIQVIEEKVIPGENRSANRQALYQLLALLFTFTIATIAGIVTGGLLKLFSPWIGNVSDEDTFDDRFMWSVSDEGDLDDTKKFKSETNIQPLSNHNHHQIVV
ncbi:rhesus blood group-associated glycoprotein Rh50 isoform X2 [Rhodnius prolixus]|uniref:rhesus blood group-associated glycoprotein Rh50 isoform X2 n=1 Tax=Rhodnius prolixus TaxID=13249 RepID=UPI003D18D57B